MNRDLQILSAVVFLVCAAAVCGGTMPALPPPQTEGGTALREALKARRSTREFSPAPLPEQVLSTLLWAACGINRPGEILQDIPQRVVRAQGAATVDAVTGATMTSKAILKAVDDALAKARGW